jgi:hypothetical protein
VPGILLGSAGRRRRSLTIVHDLSCARAQQVNGIVNLTRSSRPSWPLSLERGQPYRRAKDFSAPDRRATRGRRVPPLLKLTMPRARMLGKTSLEKRCPSDGGPRVRIHLPPARSQQRTLWLPGASHAGGTQSSNPLCSSGESTANSCGFWR